MTTSTKPQLSIESARGGLLALLRVDQIRTDTLVSLTAGWADEDDRDHVVARLDDLSVVVQSPRHEGELDERLEQLEAAAGMDGAHVALSLSDALRLRGELDRVIARMERMAALQRGAA